MGQWAWLQSLWWIVLMAACEAGEMMVEAPWPLHFQ